MKLFEKQPSPIWHNMNIFLLLVFIRFIFCQHDNYRTYFTCYYNKYNNIENSSLTNLERDGFVMYAVNESVGAGYAGGASICFSFSFVYLREPSPSNHCVDWMCDEQVLWLRSMEDSLEIIAYYSTENNTIPSWSKCLQDDGKEFLKRNYTLINAGIT